MDNPSSPLDTLRQLKEMLDAGALTPTEFEALKQRLVFSPAPAASAAPAPTETPAPAPVATLPPPPPTEQNSPMFEDMAVDEPLPTTTPVAARAFETDSPAAFSPTNLSAAPALEPTQEPVPAWRDQAFPAMEEEPPVRNSLALILSIGGVLVFLAVVAYLSFNRPPSERISSTSMTAADSTAAVIETGPQAEQLPQTEAMPETVRVAPTNPAPVIQPRATPVARDSMAAVPAAPRTDSAAGQ